MPAAAPLTSDDTDKALLVGGGLALLGAIYLFTRHSGCSASNPCPAGQACVSGKCVTVAPPPPPPAPPCSATNPCPAGYDCISGVCVVHPVPPGPPTCATGGTSMGCGGAGDLPCSTCLTSGGVPAEGPRPPCCVTVASAAYATPGKYWLDVVRGRWSYMNGSNEYYNEIGFRLYEDSLISGTYDGTTGGRCGGPPPAPNVMQSFAWRNPAGVGNNWIRMCDNPFPPANSEIDVGSGALGFGH